MSELPKAYNPAEHETHINDLWDASGYFNPDNLPFPETAPAYTVILPPPNVTDRLHLGHASMLAIQEVMVRFHRMNGYRTLWLPGTDHAAIATQAVVERALYKEEGKTRHDLGREEFLRRVYEAALKNQATIISQFKNFGASLDWSRLAFTLDDERKEAVKKMFVDMYEAGAIYRGERIVNWCPRCNSTLADDEVEYKAEKTILYTFKYWKDFPIAISSTRPETKLGDTAVAVNPSDERYKEYVGKEFSGEFCGQPLAIRIIADREVDMSFGTGALGVTPAHSMIDWRMAEEHDLPIVKVIDEGAKIRSGFGNFSGQSAADARALIVEELKNNNLIEKEEEIEHNVATCYRCGTVIEPLPSKQWFVAVDKPLERLNGKSLKQAALEVSENNSIAFVPVRFKKRYEDWMRNLRDWCISRQIWFGHPIPVWYKGDEIYVGAQAPGEEGWKQDEDTLDTWFSSGMWTFSTLGWPKETKDLKKFHPTDFMETGYEIITLWISRMIMMSLFTLQEIPFRTVYLHGMVLDAQGKKMSKSKGNGIDPMVVGAEYGNDAVRLALLIGNTPGVDVRLSEEKIAGFRNLINKIWNISRYILSQPQTAATTAETTITDTWIMSRLNATVAHVTEKIKAYDFSTAGELLREFTLDDLADWYLEASKFEGGNKAELLKGILQVLLKLWHPFTPFITETIWRQLGEKDLLLVSAWPEAAVSRDENAEQSFNRLRAVITAVRNLRSEHKLPPAQKIKAYVYGHEYAESLKQSRNLIMNLRTGIGELEISENGERIENALYANVEGIEIYLEAAIDKAAEKARLEKEIEKVMNGISMVETKLRNEEFVSKAPALLVEKEKEKLDNYHEALKKLREAVDNC